MLKVRCLLIFIIGITSYRIGTPQDAADIVNGNLIQFSEIGRAHV